jgi:hypothetical protein
MSNLIDVPQASHETQNLEKLYAQLHDKKAQFTQIAKTLNSILERVGNEEDCFWISHAWAESLVTGKTVSKKNFPYGSMMEIRHDALWRKDQEGYKGAHVSLGAESYMITIRTQGQHGNLPAREYHNLTFIEDIDALQQFCEGLPNGSLGMVLLGYEGTRNGHALLVCKINGNVVFIDNSVEPGPWIKNIDEFKKYSGSTHCHIYLYPERIFSFPDQKEEVITEETKPFARFSKFLKAFG